MPSSDPEEAVVERILTGGDPQESCRELYRLNFGKVLAFFRRKHFSEEEARDLTQDTFFRVFSQLNDFRRETSFQRWLFEIAASVWKNELRRLGAVKRDAEEEPLDESFGKVLAGPFGQAQPDVMLEKERVATIRAAFADMPEQMRRCCYLRYEKGLKYREIAAVMKISIETVKSHLHQARKRLISRLQEASEE